MFACERACVCESERERERERVETERLTDGRQKYVQTDKWTQIQTQRQSGRLKTGRGRQTDRQTETETDRQTETETDRQTDRHKQRDRQTETEKTDRQKDRYREIERNCARLCMCETKKKETVRESERQRYVYV